MSNSLDVVLSDYENIIMIGDVNINSLDKNSSKYTKLKNFCYTFDFKNLIKVPTCFQSIDNPSSIDVILTNRNKSFMHSKSVTCGLSDHHSLVCTMFRTHISILKPIEVNYRCFRKFDELAFLADLESAFSNTNFSELANGYARFFKNL